MSCISTESGIMGYITNVQKKNFAAEDSARTSKVRQETPKACNFQT